jgi:squalene synthase HpnC
MIDGDGAAPVRAATTPAVTLAELGASALRQHSAENFPVALRVVPRRPRAQLLSVYAFARFVDDVGDEAPGDRLALLDLIAKDVRTLGTGTPTLAPVAGLAPVIADCGLSIDPLLDLIEANRVDQRVSRYSSFEELLGYCRLSAAPVGRIVLCLAGVNGASAVAMSDAICAGLQVLEHCQDVGEDARADRVYLPADDLRVAGVADSDLLLTTTSPALRRVIALQVQRARDLLGSGRPLIRQLHGWARLALLGYVAGGLATADALDAADYDVLSRAVTPTKMRTAVAAARLAAGAMRP